MVMKKVPKDEYSDGISSFYCWAKLHASTWDELQKKIADYLRKYPYWGYMTNVGKIVETDYGYRVKITRSSSCD